jgi:HSP20 family molecular chaperone IbpA
MDDTEYRDAIFDRDPSWRTDRWYTVPYYSNRELGDFGTRRNELFPEVYREAFTDMDETEKEYIITIEMPGVRKDEIKLNIEEDAVTISVQKEDREEELEERYFWKQQTYRGFYKRMHIPQNADPDKISATYRNGVLEVHIPKKETRGRNIKID